MTPLMDASSKRHGHVRPPVHARAGRHHVVAPAGGLSAPRRPHRPDEGARLRRAQGRRQRRPARHDAALDAARRADHHQVPRPDPPVQLQLPDLDPDPEQADRGGQPRHHGRAGHPEGRRRRRGRAGAVPQRHPGAGLRPQPAAARIRRRLPEPPGLRLVGDPAGRRDARPPRPQVQRGPDQGRAGGAGVDRRPHRHSGSVRSDDQAGRVGRRPGEPPRRGHAEPRLERPVPLPFPRHPPPVGLLRERRRRAVPRDRRRAGPGLGLPSQLQPGRRGGALPRAGGLRALGHRLRRRRQDHGRAPGGDARRVGQGRVAQPPRLHHPQGLHPQLVLLLGHRPDDHGRRGPPGPDLGLAPQTRRHPVVPRRRPHHRRDDPGERVPAPAARGQPLAAAHQPGRHVPVVVRHPRLDAALPRAAGVGRAADRQERRPHGHLPRGDDRRRPRSAGHHARRRRAREIGRGQRRPVAGDLPGLPTEARPGAPLPGRDRIGRGPGRYRLGRPHRPGGRRARVRAGDPAQHRGPAGGVDRHRREGHPIPRPGHPVHRRRAPHEGREAEEGPADQAGRWQGAVRQPHRAPVHLERGGPRPQRSPRPHAAARAPDRRAGVLREVQARPQPQRGHHPRQGGPARQRRPRRAGRPRQGRPRPLVDSLPTGRRREGRGRGRAGQGIPDVRRRDGRVHAPRPATARATAGGRVARRRQRRRAPRPGQPGGGRAAHPA